MKPPVGLVPSAQIDAAFRPETPLAARQLHQNHLDDFGAYLEVTGPDSFRIVVPRAARVAGILEFLAQERDRSVVAHFTVL